MTRPRIICHMTASLDGKVTGFFLTLADCAAAIEEYYRINRELGANGFICGRVTMEESFTHGYFPDLSKFKDAKIPEEDYIADPDAVFLAVAFDRHGKLGWTSSQIQDDDPGYGGAHIVEVLCSGVNPSYLAYLRSIGVSYIFADDDIELALQKLRRAFAINTLLLEGGSEINGAFLRAGMVDEISLVTAPLVAAAEDKPLFFNGIPEQYELMSCETLSGGILHIRYRRLWSAF